MTQPYETVFTGTSPYEIRDVPPDDTPPVVREITITIRYDPEKTRREFVVEYLRQRNVAYVKEMLDAWNDYRKQIHKSPGTYGAFRVLINRMKGDGELVLDHTEDTDFNGYPRHYYRLAEQK